MKTCFAGKRIYEASTKAAIHDGAALVRTSRLPKPGAWAVMGAAGIEQQVQQAKAQQAATRTGAYKHLMTGVSYTIPSWLPAAC